MQPSRRQVLAGAAVLLGAACTEDRRTARPSPSTSAVDPDVALRSAAAAREQSLLSLYDALLAGTPALRAELAPYRADHAAHLAALLPPGSPAPVPPVVPRTSPVRLRAAIVAGERRTAAAHATACGAASADLAAVLASLAACEASHAALL